MKTAFRKKTIINFFLEFEKLEKAPLDLLLGQFLKKNRSLGSQDRKMISETIYGVVRNLGLINALLGKSPSWEERVELFLSEKLNDLAQESSIAPCDRLNLPKELYDTLIESIGEEKTIQFAKATLERAPITIRVNLLKTTRESLWERWKDLYNISLCQKSPNGIIFHERINFFETAEFSKGLFELQDEASQLVSDLVKVLPGEEFLDFCAGSGGKSLAIAPRMQNKGQIFLHDIREKSLISAKKRLKRAGVQNAQIIYNNPKKFSRLKNRLKWILVDAPCTGSGTWRRNPDHKWKFSNELLDRITLEQREIFKEALTYLHPEGKIIYATCSVLPQENEDQITYFLKTHGLTLSEPPFQSFPKPGGMDGFFAVIMTRPEKPPKEGNYNKGKSKITSP